MKKIILLFLWVLFIWNSFASYTLTVSQVKKINQLAKLVIEKVETKYHDRKKQNEIFWDIANTIDLYIFTHKLTDNQKAALLCFKTLILQHMGYKIWNPVKVKIVNDISS